MSLSLYWRPVRTDKTRLSDELKYAMRKSLLSGGPTKFNYDTLPYLQGLADAGVKGAEELMEKVNKYGVIEVWQGE